MPIIQTRRRFLTTLSLGAIGLLLHSPRAPAAEGPLETTSVRLAKTPDICGAPQYVAAPLLRAEGITDVNYVEVPNPTAGWIGRGEVDFSFGFASALITAIDAGAPIVILAGLHVGCVEVFVNKGIRSIADLKGKRVGVEFIASTLSTISAGSPVPRSTRCNCLWMKRLMRSSALRPGPWICASGISGR